MTYCYLRPFRASPFLKGDSTVPRDLLRTLPASSKTFFCKFQKHVGPTMDHALVCFQTFAPTAPFTWIILSSLRLSSLLCSAESFVKVLLQQLSHLRAGVNPPISKNTLCLLLEPACSDSIVMACLCIWLSLWTENSLSICVLRIGAELSEGFSPALPHFLTIL